MKIAGSESEVRTPQIRIRTIMLQIRNTAEKSKSRQLWQKVDVK